VKYRWGAWIGYNSRSEKGNAMRFVRTEYPYGTQLLFARKEVARLPPMKAMDGGEFMARLWALFGPAEATIGGFLYDLQDTAWGVSFRAAGGPVDPAYYGPPDVTLRSRMREIIEALEAELAKIKPVDCVLRYKVDAEPGSARRAMGWLNGRSFDRAV
jgi:hypothetical protein